NMQDLSLGGIMFIMDAAGELGGFYDKNKLGMVSDHQSLEGSRILITDVEKLGLLNVNQLGAINDKMSGLGVIVY
ncbi:MAG TPA: hypothetical protein PK401_00300, partial [Bacteroidales bacterium]|nr:hypothetical protein [Bacteroidales bacterium]HPJ54516.1 hypothetical protein [Bacteroidales bacterium]